MLLHAHIVDVSSSDQTDCYIRYLNLIESQTITVLVYYTSVMYACNSTWWIIGFRGRIANHGIIILYMYMYVILIDSESTISVTPIVVHFNVPWNPE